MPHNKPNLFDEQSIDASLFLSEYWQKKPYLFSKSCLPTDCLPNKKELFGLAEHPDVQSRIVYQNSFNHFMVEHDNPELWHSLKSQKATLLVSDIDKWHSQSLQLLDYLPFIQNWRFDDLMMSYAPTGSSVGAHIDQYDVFLFQVSGQRRWQFNHQKQDRPLLEQGGDLATLQSFDPDSDVVLNPGDVLYLPPGFAHHGISESTDCITCSIGLRAPSHAEIIHTAAELIQQTHQQRLLDSQPVLKAKSQINDADIASIRSIFQSLAELDNATIAEISGTLISNYRTLDALPESAAETGLKASQKYNLSPFYKALYYQINKTDALLFIDGSSYRCSIEFAQIIADQKIFSGAELLIHTEHLDVIEQWIENGIIGILENL